MDNPSEDIELGGFSHIGPVRDENQDSICWAEDIADTSGSLFAVADGTQYLRDPSLQFAADRAQLGQSVCLDRYLS